MTPADPATGSNGGDKPIAHSFTRFATATAARAGKPSTFLLAVSVVVAWGLTGPLFGYSDTWQLVINTGTTVVTFLMVFLIQNSQNRDAAALQAKLDELIRAVEGARDEFIGIEHLSDAKIEKIRAALEREADADDKSFTAPEDSVERLLKRR